METQPFLSVIIPVYNSEKYLSQCLDSILCQDDSSFEVIIVDDGSSDASTSIAQDYACRDNRFRLICQENQGTSAARNTGIAAANGAYITFMDNDDFWRRNDSISSIRKVAESTQADFIAHEAVVFHDQERVFDKVRQPEDCASRSQSLDKRGALKLLLNHGLLTVTVWSKVCSAQLVKDANLLFPSGMRNEDTLWVFRAMLHAKKVAWCPNSFYAYRCGHGYAQTSKPISEANLSDLVKVIMSCIEELDKCQLSDEDAMPYNSFLAYAYVVWMAQSTLFGKTYKESKEFATMKELKWLVGCDFIPSVRLAKMSMNLCGFECTRWLLGRYLLKQYPTVKRSNGKRS